MATQRARAYRQYLETKDWQHKRRLKWKQTERCCEVCGNRNDLHTHHIVYRREWQHTKQKDLRIVCQSCHYLIHQLIKSKELEINSFNVRGLWKKTVTAVRRVRKIKDRDVVRNKVARPHKDILKEAALMDRWPGE